MNRLLLLLALSGCIPNRTQPTLPPIPTEVISQLGPVPVLWVDSLTNGEGRSMSGGFHTLRRTIFLKRDLQKNPTVAWVVLVHEQCHVWSIDSGVAAQVPPDVMQAICDAQAAYRVAEMLQSSRKPR